MARERIFGKLHLDERGESIEAFAHARHARGQPDADTCRWRDHPRAYPTC
jgi:hypothetical protein